MTPTPFRRSKEHPLADPVARQTADVGDRVTHTVGDEEQQQQIRHSSGGVAAGAERN